MFVEGFLAGVDFLGSQPMVDRARIGVLGVCASGAFSLAAAQIDPRIKAVATVSMYDMGGAMRDRITSYNVCYTKLLRNLLQHQNVAGEVGQRGGADQVREDGDVEGRGRCARNRHRGAGGGSYNFV